MWVNTIDIIQGPFSLTFFQSKFEFDGNAVLISSRLKKSDRYTIVGIIRQPCCRGMCKYLLRSDEQRLNYTKEAFPSNCEQNTANETRPNVTSRAIWRPCREYYTPQKNKAKNTLLTTNWFDLEWMSRQSNATATFGTHFYKALLNSQ